MILIGKILSIIIAIVILVLINFIFAIFVIAFEFALSFFDHNS